MNLEPIKSRAVALLLCGLLFLLVGTYTDNGGFQLAGVLLLLVTAIRALSQASKRE